MWEAVAGVAGGGSGAGARAWASGQGPRRHAGTVTAAASRWGCTGGGRWIIGRGWGWSGWSTRAWVWSLAVREDRVMSGRTTGKPRAWPVATRACEHALAGRAHQHAARAPTVGGPLLRSGSEDVSGGGVGDGGGRAVGVRADAAGPRRGRLRAGGAAG